MNYIEDEHLGKVILVESAKAKRITFRYKDDSFRVSYPMGVSLRFVAESISEFKPRLLKLKEKSPNKRIFSPSGTFSALTFDLEIKENNLANYYIQLKNQKLSITFPHNTDYQDDNTQRIIRSAIEQAMRLEAKRLFPQKVRSLAQKHGFTYSQVKINKSKTRWGSCSGRKSINLSYYCMLLPENLVDFIILHELCHTMEMNHGQRFWALLDSVSGGRAKALTQELKDFKTSL